MRALEGAIFFFYTNDHSVTISNMDYEKLYQIHLATRQQGSTTKLLAACNDHGGTLIVNSLNMKMHAKKIAKENSYHNAIIMTISEAESMKESIKGPVFYDNALVFSMIQQPDTKSKEKSKRLMKSINVRITEDDYGRLAAWNNAIYDGEASDSMLVRIALRNALNKINF